MLSEALAALAGIGGTAVVQAMATDGWEGAKSAFSRVLGRGDARRGAQVAAELEQGRAVLAGAAPHDLDAVRDAQVDAWRLRLAALLEDHPQAEAELRRWLESYGDGHGGGRGRAGSGAVNQTVVGFDHAQQAVQGRGTQQNRFGNRGTDG